MALDRRTFLTAVSVAPAASLITTSTGCQSVANTSPPIPPIKSLRELELDDAIEPASAFAPLRRRS